MSGPPSIGTAMLVDDSELDRMLHRRVVERSGHVRHLLDFDGAEPALAHLRRTDRAPVELLLLDVRMPRIDGFGFLERAVDEFGDGFVAGGVVMLTTSRDPADLARAAGFDIVVDYLAKPLLPEAVADLARRPDGTRSPPGSRRPTLSPAAAPGGRTRTT